MARFWGAVGVLGIFAALVVMFQTGFGRIDPEDQYRSILASRFDNSASPFRSLAEADPVSDLEERGRATAVAVFDGPGLHETLAFTVHQTDDAARAVQQDVRRKYGSHDTFQDINAFPSEFCVRLPRHRLDCFRWEDNLSLHSSVTPLPSEWDAPSFKTEFEPLYLLRTGYKGWIAWYSLGKTERR